MGAHAYKDRAESIKRLVQNLDPTDFETLIDMILYRMAFTRESILGEQEKAFDGMYKDLRSDTQTLYVQVKCRTGLKEFVDFNQDYLALKEEEPQSKGLFAFHTADNLSNSSNEHLDMQIWDGETIAQHVIRLGLEPWILDRVYA